MFACPAITDHGLLDLHGLVLKNGKIHLRCSQEDDASGLSHANASGHIVAKKQLLNGQGFRPGGLQELVHIQVQGFQPFGKLHTGRCGDDATLEQPGEAPLSFQQGKASRAIARINA